MKRYAVTGLAIAASLLSVVAVSGAATKKKVVKPKKVTVNCTVNFSNQAPSSDTAYVPGSSSGAEFGTVSCNKYLHVGAQQSDFTLQDSGDKTGKYKQYFDGGTVSGTYDSTPVTSDSAPLQSNGDFTSQSYTGTITLTKGTGVYKGAKAKKLGTYNCNTADGVHFTCKEHITIIEPLAKK